MGQSHENENGNFVVTLSYGTSIMNDLHFILNTYCWGSIQILFAKPQADVPTTFMECSEIIFFIE